MGANLSRVSQDELPLPPGYSCREDRKVAFLNSTASDGLKGLAWAVLLQAVADGCNPAWLAQLAAYYHIEVRPELFFRHPVSTAVVRSKQGAFVRSQDCYATVPRPRARLHPAFATLDLPADAVDAEIRKA